MKRFLALVLPALLLAACASAPDSKQQANAGSTTKSGTPYNLTSEGMPVGVIPAAVLHDPQRNKDIEVSIDYPAKGGPYPVVILSPNYGGSRSDYVGLSAFWASHGYVVMKVSHADAGALREALRQRAEERRAEFEKEGAQGRRRQREQPAQQQASAPFRPDPTEVWQSQTPADWRNRVADISFLIDSLPRLVEQYPEIKERVDATRVGVGGHSYGAFTAMLIGGVTTFGGGKPTSYADPRVKAIEAMSAPGPSTERGLTPESFATLRIPALFLTGTRVMGATESEDTAWRKRAYELCPAGDNKWFVAIQGAGSSAFTGQMGDFGFGPERPMDMPYPTNRPPVGGAYPQQQPMQPGRVAVLPGVSGAGNVRTISLAFWDAYLKNDNAGRDYLSKLRNRGDLQVESK